MTETTRYRGRHLFSAVLRRGYSVHASANTLRSLVEGGGVERHEKGKRNKVASIRSALMDSLLGLAGSELT